MTTQNINEVGPDEAHDDPPEGYFKNGDLWFGEQELEEGKYWYRAYPQNGDLFYDTDEMPTRYPLFTLVRFDEGTPEAEVNQYFAGSFQ